MSNDTRDSHVSVIDADDIDVVVNVGYDLGASPLLVKTLLFNLSSRFTYL